MHKAHSEGEDAPWCVFVAVSIYSTWADETLVWCVCHTEERSPLKLGAIHNPHQAFTGQFGPPPGIK